MAVDPHRRERVLRAAAEVYAEHSVINAGRRDIARAAGLPLRTVSAVGRHRVDLLREVVASLPFPPVAEHLQAQARQPAEPALQALLRVAREALGDPAAAWDPLEVQALVAGRYDEPTRQVVVARLNERWDAAQQVIRQLRGSAEDDRADGSFGSDTAALHMIATGLGLAVLAPLSDRWSDARSWTALAARLFEAMAVPASAPAGGPSVEWRARVRLPYVPNSTASLLRVLSLLGVHVVSLFTGAVNEREQLVDLFLRAPADIERATIVQGLASVGTDVIVTRGLADDAEDIATRVLQLSAHLASDPAAAPRAAADLVLADSWEVTTAAQGADASAYVLRLQWTVDRHVILRRVKAPFTRIEQHRASALLELVGALAEARGGEEAFGWRETLADGRSVSVRLGRPEDMDGVERMHGRSSPASIYQRYFTPMNEWREDNLRRISGGHRGTTLVVTDRTSEIVALGNVFPVGPDDKDAAEIAVIVDDAWHGSGLGLALTEHLIGVARRLTFSRLVAYVLADNRAMRGLLERTSLAWTPKSDHDFGASVVCLQADLPPLDADGN